MQAIILKCKPQSRFHLGETTEVRSNTLTDTSTYIHSDVLFSAFVVQMSLLYPEKTETFIAYFQDEKIKISSSFYCLEHTATKQKIFFLPKPVSLNLWQKEGIDHKKLKKIQFLSWKVWQEQLLPDQWLDTQFCYLIADRFVVHRSEIENDDEIKNLSLYQKDDALKVRKHTTEEDGNLYSQTDLFLLGNEHYTVHWHFLYQTNLSQ
ncbi:MAG: type III-A CRISPR-associated RAMP protein Csm4, partial [Raineya sp.]